MWTIDSLWVSSNSSAWDSAPLAKAAAPTLTRCPLPRIRLGPGGFIAVQARVTDSPNGVGSPASARPITSRTRSLVLATTSAGRSSKRSPHTQSASFSE